MQEEQVETNPHTQSFVDKLLGRKRISQKMIKDFADLQRNVMTLRKELKAGEEMLDAYGQAYAKMLATGMSQEPGDLRLIVETTIQKVRVAWKEAFAKACGPEAVERAQREAGTKPVTKLTIVSNNDVRFLR